ncbi:glycosyltransferase 8 domain-containing protein 2 isoform 1-T1 [Leptodactylus fuscus]|uniref:glycosyltransferase 8 domain-containing protein 2 isoform X1 n=1 Tax=Leptodactylus fuscus TaxID=238119 RepID=UPI003F4F0D15
MAILRKLNHILLFLLVLTFCAIWYSTISKAPALKEHEGKHLILSLEEEEEEVIPVVICAASGRMGATIAAINSIYSNTNANVLFYIIGLKNSLVHIRKWIEETQLSEIQFKIVEFNPMVLKGKIRHDAAFPELLQPLNFVRFYLPLLTSEHEKVIYLDDDVIVLGDIQELYNTKISTGHIAAFSDDCDLPSLQDVIARVGIQNTYMGFLDYRKKTVQKLGISPSTCSFNPGVFVANMTEWRQQHITKKLEKWMKKNVEENLYSSTIGGGVSTPPMLIVFHGKYSVIPPAWHIRHLGLSPDDQLSQDVVQDAKLLHWNGRFKPWKTPCSHYKLWEKWFIPDPTGKFRIRRI